MVRRVQQDRLDQEARRVYRDNLELLVNPGLLEPVVRPVKLGSLVRVEI